MAVSERDTLKPLGIRIIAIVCIALTTLNNVVTTGRDCWIQSFLTSCKVSDNPLRFTLGYQKLTIGEKEWESDMKPYVSEIHNVFGD